MTTTTSTVLHSIFLFVAAAALLLAAAHDVAVRTVPNLVSAIVAAAGLGVNALDARLGPALFCGGLVFAGCWYCWRRGWIGGGDVKLLSACAMLVPPASVPELVLATAIAGGALALFYLGLERLLPAGATTHQIGAQPTRPRCTDLQRTGPRRTGLLMRIWRAERRRIRRRLSLPYACAISAGVLLTLNISVPLG